jgi:hypothetical protein
VLGKGSFGQVLKVLDYQTGSYRALKIIRNKKRFHHQAQVRPGVLNNSRHDHTNPNDRHRSKPIKTDQNRTNTHKTRQSKCNQTKQKAQQHQTRPNQRKTKQHHVKTPPTPRSSSRCCSTSAPTTPTTPTT